MSELENGPPKPRFWRTRWTAMIIAAVLIVGVVLFSVLPLIFEFAMWERVLVSVALTLVILGSAYYFRVHHSATFNRAIYVFSGAFEIGFVLWIIWEVAIGWRASGFITIVSMMVCYGLGALAGDLIGDSRNYTPSLSPSSPNTQEESVFWKSVEKAVSKQKKAKNEGYRCRNCLLFDKPSCKRNERLLNANPCQDFKEQA